MTRRIPIGVSDFEILRTGNFYYVDKTMLAAEVVRSGASTILLPRPRRFGKTMNLSMLHRFFDMDGSGASLFDGLAVAGHADVMAHCGQYPTVFLTFKDIKYSDYSSCYDALGMALADVFRKHEQTILKAKPEYIEKQMVDAILRCEAKAVWLQSSLALLTRLLHRATGRRVIILLDDSDTPIHAGFHNYYDKEITGFMDNLLTGCFQDNSHLEKGVIAGALQIAKRATFPGLDFDVHTILNESFSSHFGFSEGEVSAMLDNTGQGGRLADVRTWYKGYRFGSHTVYNPWSVIHDAAYPQNMLEA